MTVYEDANTVDISTKQVELQKLLEHSEQLWPQGANRYFEIQNEVIGLASQLSFPDLHLRALLNRAFYYRSNNQPRLAETDIRTVETRIAELNDDLATEFLKKIGMLYGHLFSDEAQYAVADSYYFESLRLAQAQGDRAFEARIHYYLATNSNYEGDQNRAIEHFKKVLELHNAHDDFYASCLLDLAYFCLEGGDYVNARVYTDEAMSASIADHILHCSLYCLSSRIAIEETTFDVAVEVGEKAVDLARTKAPQRLVLSLMTRGEAFMESGEVLAALHDYEEAFKRLDEIERFWKGTNQITWGKKLWTPVVYYHLALGYALQQANHGDSQSDAKQKAIEYLQLANNGLQTLPEVSQIRYLHYAARTQSIFGNHKGAYDALMSALKLRDKLFTAKVRNEIGSFRLLMKAEREQHEKELEKMKHKQTEQELSNSTLQLIAQTELLEELRESLTSIIRKLPAGNEVAKELREKLRNLPCKSVDWERFDMQFKAAHPEFTQKLSKDHPTLSTTELRICSLVRMNLKSDEIARLFCLSARTIENHRYNIRRKMDLAEGADLAKALMKL